MVGFRALRGLAPRAAARLTPSKAPASSLSASSASLRGPARRALHTHHFGRAREAPVHLTNKYPVIVRADLES
jgi:hypothetical protein